MKNIMQQSGGMLQPTRLFRRKANPSTSPHRSNRVLQMDGVGKVLHEIYGFHQHCNNPDWKNTDDDPSYYITLWVITDKNGYYDKENGIMVMYSGESNEAFIYDANTAIPPIG